MTKDICKLITVCMVMIVLIAQSSLAQDSYESFKKRQDSLFNSFKEDADKKYNDFVARQDSLYNAFVKKVDQLWNDKVYPSKKEYVEYKNNYTSRTSIDFEQGQVESSVLIEVNEASTAKISSAQEELKRELVKTISTPGKEEVYISHDQPEERSIVAKPMLEHQIYNLSGKEVNPQNAREFVEEIIKDKPILVDTIISTDGVKRIKLTAHYELVPDHLKKRAKIYLDDVYSYSKKYELDPRLVLAIMHTESYFNPRATSQVPAFGLMQIVPTTAGRDAYKFIYGEDKLLSKDYLYNPKNNIELGCAYLKIVRNNYLKIIADDQLAYPCVIASYNGGIGTLCKALTGTKKLSGLGDAVNGKEFDALINLLNRQLPYQETRDYLNRVLERMPFYDEWVN